MKSPHKLSALASMLAGCFLAQAAGAGVVVEQEQRQPGSDTPEWQTTYYLEAGRLRIDSRSARGDHSLILFEESRQVVWIIDQAAGTYYELTPATVQRMSERMEEARQEMEAALADMPPEQRQAMEQMMRQQMGLGAPVTVRLVARGETVGPFTCTRYERLRNGERTGELWAAPPEQLQLQATEYETLQALARFLAPLGASNPLGPAWGEGSEQVEGFPVRSLLYDGQRVVAEENVRSAERRELEADLFVLPAGLEKEEVELE